MVHCDTLIRNASVLDGSGSDAQIIDVAISGERICGIGLALSCHASRQVDANGLVLAPGFIDVHTHDDTL